MSELSNNNNIWNENVAKDAKCIIVETNGVYFWNATSITETMKESYLLDRIYEAGYLNSCLNVGEANDDNWIQLLAPEQMYVL